MLCNRMRRPLLWGRPHGLLSPFDSLPSQQIYALGFKGPRKLEWMKNLLGVLHDMQQMMFHVLLDFEPTFKRWV